MMGRWPLPETGSGRSAIAKGEIMKQKRIIEKARNIGMEAFNAGKKAIPALDKELWALQESPEMEAFGPPQIGRSIPVLKAWAEGWTEANLDAPIPGWTDEENQNLRDYRAAYKAGLV
jgi:hypothetical protein